MGILQTKYPKYRKEGVTLIIHDWGSAIGQRMIVKYPELVSRAVILDIGDSMPLKKAGDTISVFMYQGFNICCFLLPSFIGTAMMRYCLYKVSDSLSKIPM